MHESCFNPCKLIQYKQQNMWNTIYSVLKCYTDFGFDFSAICVLRVWLATTLFPGMTFQTSLYPLHVWDVEVHVVSFYDCAALNVTSKYAPAISLVFTTQYYIHVKSRRRIRLTLTIVTSKISATIQAFRTVSVHKLRIFQFHFSVLAFSGLRR